VGHYQVILGGDSAFYSNSQRFVTMVHLFKKLELVLSACELDGIHNQRRLPCMLNSA